MVFVFMLISVFFFKACKNVGEDDTALTAWWKHQYTFVSLHFRAATNDYFDNRLIC